MTTNKDRDEIFDGVHWRNGMLLSAKHFKDVYRLINSNVNFKLENSEYFQYGIIDLELCSNYIHDGIIRLKKILCIMHNGDIIDFDYSVHKYNIFINLGEKSLIENKVYTICVALVKDNPSKILDKERSFVYEVSPIFDSELFNQKTSIKRLKIFPYLFLNDEIDSSYSFLPILKIVKNQNNYFITDDYIPPLLHINWKIELFREIVAIIDDMVAKAENISEKIRILVMSGAPSLDAVNQVRSYYAIIPGLTRVNLCIKNEFCSPKTLFNSLVEFIPMLSLAVNKKIKFFHNFNFCEIYESFKPIKSIIKEYSKYLFTGITIAIPFEKDIENCIFKSFLSQDYVISNGFYIAISSENLTNQTLISMALDMIISSFSLFDNVKQIRTKGAKRILINDRKLLNDIKIDTNINSLILFVELGQYACTDELLCIDIGNKHQDVNFNLIRVNKEYGIGDN